MGYFDTKWIFAGVFALLINAGYSQNNSIWTIPAGGNSFLVKKEKRMNDSVKNWEASSDSCLLFFSVSKPCPVELSLNLAVPQGKSELTISVGGKNFKVLTRGNLLHKQKIGNVLLEAGYSRVIIQGVRKQGPVFANIESMEIQSKTEGVELNFVKDNLDNRFYWGRRGPSVHLNYELPEGSQVEYFYNEVTVPVGMDPIGSYFMADGFGEGYFGMQVNGPEERRVLFSVWSPYHTDHPGDIPDSERIVLLAKGDGVHTGEFGNEGSGGQSYFRTNWVAGTTYGFLLKGTPDGKGNTVYTAWFHDPKKENWQLVASFRRPKTDRYLTHLHSFVENFEDQNGYLTRKAHYSNAWCVDKNGKWFPLLKARLTGDDIARRGYRLDYAGGTEGDGYYLQNGGFFNNSGCKLQSSLQLQR
jgi:hypothetical protein